MLNCLDEPCVRVTIAGPVANTTAHMVSYTMFRLFDHENNQSHLPASSPSQQVCLDCRLKRLHQLGEVESRSRCYLSEIE